MVWINQNLLYIIWVLSLVISVVLFFVLCRLNPKARRKRIVALGFTAAFILAFRIVFFTIRGYFEGGTDLMWRQFIFSLPGHLCGVSSIIIPIAILTKKTFLLNYTYFIALPASLFAIMLNSSVGVTSFVSDLDTYIFWVPHLMYVIVPIYLIAFEGVRPSIKSIPKILLTLIIILTIAHIVNISATWFFQDYVVNYMYTMGPGDFINAVGDGLGERQFHIIGFLEVFWNLLPVDYIYMLLLLPLVVLVCFVMYIPLYVLKCLSKRGESL
ncbi:MAG: YwaF family protein [Defluviitaleaceae bacterium]|nr:YwaF family protein [Defluviitaleaceae bacterium]